MSPFELGSFFFFWRGGRGAGITHIFANLLFIQIYQNISNFYLKCSVIRMTEISIFFFLLRNFLHKSVLVVVIFTGMGHLRIFPDFFFFTSVEKKT